MPSAVIVENASMPHSYLLLYVGELMNELNYALGRSKYLAFEQMIILFYIVFSPD